MNIDFFLHRDGVVCLTIFSKGWGGVLRYIFHLN